METILGTVVKCKELQIQYLKIPIQVILFRHFSYFFVFCNSHFDEIIDERKKLKKETIDETIT